jgi:uncharacterized protein YndB with AHSA1/START domain
MMEARASIQIQKPVEIVFDAIVNPAHLCRYFISESSGSLTTGAELDWEFPEFPGKFPVNQIKITPPDNISFVWDPVTVVSIILKSLEDGSTVVGVTESGWGDHEDNIPLVIRNTEGWANFLACLKAYLEYGINLRKGAFNFMAGTSI